MKKVISILIGLAGIISAAKPHMGDPVKFYVNRFMLILYRDQVEKTGIVRYVGDNFAIVTPGEKIKINDIVRRNWINIAYPDSFDYFVATSESDFCFTSRKKTGEYWEQQKQGLDATGLKDIYRILTNPKPPQTVGNWSVVYFATDKGVYSQRQNVPPTGNFGKIAFTGQPVYSLVYHPDSTGPITSAGGIEILYAGTSNGVYKLRVRKNTVQYPDSLADVIPIGTLNKSIKALAVNPVDKSIYAGGEKLWHWTGTSWQEVPEVTSPVNEIKFINNILFVLTEDALFYNDGAWHSDTTLKNLYDIEYAYNYYWLTSLGKGVYRANSPSSTWDKINNGFEYLENYGSLNCRAIYFDPFKNKLFVGNEQGVWQFDISENKWKNKSRGIKKFIADYEVEQIKYVMEEYTGENIFNKIKNVLKVKDEELWDMNADSVIHIILYPLEVSGDSTLNITKPLYGYFDEYDLDPSNPYASLKEIFVLNINYDTTILYKNYFTGELRHGILAKYLAYLFGEYANWSIEHNESKPVRCGFSMLALHLAGFNIFNGTKNIGITPKRDWAKSVRRIGFSAFDYTKNWLRAPVSRELDRERMSYLFLYLREKLTSYFQGDETKADSFIFKVMMRDKEKDGKALFEHYLRKINSSFSEFIESWFLANLLDNDPEFNYYYQTVDSIFDYTNLGTFTREFTSTITTDILPPLAPRYLRKINATDTLYYNFDFKDGFGDATYGFRVYKIDLVNKNITKIQFDTLKEYLNDSILIIKRAVNTISEKSPPGSYYYAVLNTYGVDGYFAYSHDVTPPSIYKKYIIQNPVFTNALDFYIIGKKIDLLYGDATATVSPFIILRPFDKKLPSSSFDIKLSETGDSVAIYTVSYTLPSSIKGDLLVYSYAQDIVGNKLKVFYDTISVKKIAGGGMYAFLNDKIILEVPENSGFEGVVIATKLPYNYSEKLPSPYAYSIGHSNIIFSKPVKIKFYVGEDEELKIYKMENGEIVEYSTYREENYIYSYTNSLGVFLLSNGKPVNLPGKFEVKINSNMISSNSPIKFSISLPYEGDLRINLYDAIGRRIKEIKSLNLFPGIYKFDLSSERISKGVYFLEVNAKMKKDKFLKKFKLIIF